MLKFNNDITKSDNIKQKHANKTTNNIKREREKSLYIFEN